MTRINWPVVLLTIAAYAACLIWAIDGHAQGTPVNELNTAALVGPFDESVGHKTYITAHGPGAFSFSTGVPAVITHWTFWSDSCDHLADFEVCLTLNDSIVVDVSDMGGVGIGNQRLASRFDLTGYKGLYTIHAYETDERCRDPSDRGFLHVDEAINGTWAIADTRSGAAFGDRAQGLVLGPSGAIDVPDQSFEALDLPFYYPPSLTMSEVILITVVEGFGDFVGEVGPPQGRIVIAARTRAYDTQEVALSLPDIELSCALFSSIIPGVGNLIPETLDIASSGFLRFSSPRFAVNDAGITTDEIFIYGFHGQQLGPYGAGSRATYSNPIEVNPTPTPTVSVTATPSVTPAATPTLPVATATPTASPSPTPGEATPTPTAGATPTPVATQVGITPSPTPTPNLFSPSPPLPTPTASATPVASPTPAPPTPTP